MQIVSARQTFDELNRRLRAREPLVYLRFGDGDVNLLLGQDDSYQEWSLPLGIEIAESFALQGAPIMKSLPIHSAKYGNDEGMAPGFHLAGDSFADEILVQTRAYFRDQVIWSPVALAYEVRYEPERVAEYLLGLVGESATFVGSARAVEAFAKPVGFKSAVAVPSRNAYRAIDEASASVFRDIETGTQVVALAMGCAGRVLAKRIALRFPHVSVVDCGSVISGIIGDVNERAWMESCFTPQASWDRVRGALGVSPSARRDP